MSLLHPLMDAAIRQAISAEDSPTLLQWLEQRTRPYLDASNPRLLGSGGEGVVFAANGHIHKFLLNWTHPRRDPDRTEQWLRLLAERSHEARHLYRLTIQRPERDMLWISYAASPGVPLTNEEVSSCWRTRIWPQLEACLHELSQAGFAHTNPKPSNFVWDGTRLMLCDYGSDCRPMSDAAMELGRMYFMWQAGIHDQGQP
ncbi:hypothetical protein [Corallococcus carmarthensis]|uniref:Serine/threonine protein kinase n=1 Tax=Corallococcus carmarthensis TaxID=2316728 RepID=A0A3A8JZM1_9BACT|nr:hypothetical protein [Corallococcus carmarthensis]RKG97664.1 hypothetical protein D7X32_32025 [Corallococcus carmarthensis]